MPYLYKDDPELKKIITDEANRLDNTLNLIAAENHSSMSTLEVMGSGNDPRAILATIRSIAGRISIDF